MICPQNPQDCEYGICRAQNGCSGLANFLQKPVSPPKPTMEEIERLLDSYKAAMLNFERDNCKHYRDKETAARAALLAAIRALSNSTQESE